MHIVTLHWQMNLFLNSDVAYPYFGCENNYKDYNYKRGKRNRVRATKAIQFNLFQLRCQRAIRSVGFAFLAQIKGSHKNITQHIEVERTIGISLPARSPLLTQFVRCSVFGIHNRKFICQNEFSLRKIFAPSPLTPFGRVRLSILLLCYL